MLNLFKVIALFFCIIILNCFNLCAEEVGTPTLVQPSFQLVDTNNDGAINLDEMQAHQAKNFDEADKDKNGVLGEDELKSESGKIFQKADKNSDNQVTKEEAVSQFTEYFNQIDNNKDAKIDAQEYSDNWKGVIYF